ncbi:MAG: hypothetical protein IJ568_05475 [Bacilli bacterium]|nr:hypothetical protein [Bacilli bacterium]
MELENIQKMLNEIDIEQKMLIVRKDFYEKYKQEIDELVKDNWLVDLTITNILDMNTNAIIMDKKKFYGID